MTEAAPIVRSRAGRAIQSDFLFVVNGVFGGVQIVRSADSGGDLLRIASSGDDCVSRSKRGASDVGAHPRPAPVMNHTFLSVMVDPFKIAGAAASACVARPGYPVTRRRNQSGGARVPIGRERIMPDHAPAVRVQSGSYGWTRLLEIGDGDPHSPSQGLRDRAGAAYDFFGPSGARGRLTIDKQTGDVALVPDESDEGVTEFASSRAMLVGRLLRERGDYPEDTDYRA